MNLLFKTSNMNMHAVDGSEVSNTFSVKYSWSWPLLKHTVNIIFQRKPASLRERKEFMNRYITKSLELSQILLSQTGATEM